MGSHRQSIRLVHMLLAGLVVLAQAGCSSSGWAGNLYTAAQEGSRKDASKALRDGDDINGTYNTPNERTPLHAAADRGHRKMIILLVNEDADPNLQDTDGNTPLHMSARQGHNRTVNVLLSAGADPLIRNNRDQTPRDTAVGHAKTVQALRNAGG